MRLKDKQEFEFVQENIIIAVKYGLAFRLNLNSLQAI